MTLWNNYYLASSLQGALEQLATCSGSSRVVAGGTDLLLDIQQGRHDPVDTLVDITGIPEMNCLEIRSSQLFIGAAVPLNRILREPLVRQHALALYEACTLIGGPQVRNTATLGGNVGHALPAADGTIALLAMDASAEIASLEGSQSKPVESLFLGPGRSALDPNRELIVGFELPLNQPGEASAFRRIMRPQGVAIAILNFAAWVRRKDAHIDQVRLSIGPAGPTPQRLRQTEGRLQGTTPEPASIADARDALLSETRFRTSPHRSTAEYRRQVAGVLLEETLLTAWERTFST